jgi:transcription elongation factor GreA
MSDDAANLGAIRQAVAGEDWDRVEESWLEALDEHPIPSADLLGIAEAITAGGRPNLARTLLDLLAEALESTGDHRAAFAALRELVRSSDKVSGATVERLERAFVGARAGSPSLDRILSRYRLAGARRPLEVLATMESWLDHDAGTVVEVIGQGVGRVVDVNLELENVKVDLGGSRPVSVPFGAVARYLRVLPEGSFLYRKVVEPEALAAFVRESPGESLVHALESLGEPADVPTLKAALDGVLPGDQWTSWWGKARKHPRIVTSGAGTKVRYTVEGSARGAFETQLDELETVSPRGRLVVAKRLAARGEEAATAAAARLAESLPKLETTDPGLAWETALVIRNLPGGVTPAEACLERLLTAVPPLALLEGIGDRSPRVEALDALRRARPDEWVEIWGEWLLHEESAPTLSYLAGELTGSGAEDVLDAALEALLRNHLQHPAAFIWACEAMAEPGAPAVLARRMTPSVLELIPDALTRKEFAALRQRAKGLLDGGKAAIRIILEVASPQQAARFAQRVARVGSVEPDRARLVERAAEQCRGTEARTPLAPMLVASAGAIEAKRAELKQLLEVEIPKTLKGINAAAAEGDLRENFEYHMLRDRQELLSAKAAKIQGDLAQVRPLEPGAADTSRVNIGTVTSLEALDGSPLEPVTILGAWDSDISRRIFANGTELAQALLEHSVGDEVTVEGRRARITTIEPWTGG